MQNEGYVELYVFGCISSSVRPRGLLLRLISSFGALEAEGSGR